MAEASSCVKLTEGDVKIREFQTAAASALLEKGGFAYKEPWYQELKRALLDCGLSEQKILAYEDTVVMIFLGWDLAEHKKK